MKNLFILCVASLLIFGSCRKKDGPQINDVTLTIPYLDSTYLPPELYLFAPPGTQFPGGALFPLPPMSFATMYQSYLDQYNTDAEDVRSVRLKEFSMWIVRPDGQKFDFVDSLKIFGAGENLPDVLIAKKLPVPKGLDSLSLDIPENDLKNYFLKDSMTVKLSAVINELPDSTTRI